MTLEEEIAGLTTYKYQVKSRFIITSGKMLPPFFPIRPAARGGGGGALNYFLVSMCHAGFQK